MNYVSILNQLLENKIIAILRLDSPQKAQKGIEALKKGGIQAIEVTLNTPEHFRLFLTIKMYLIC